MIPTYHCASYLQEALESVLSQDPGPEIMQIEVVDDHSPDDPRGVVEALGPGRIGFYRQPRNVGHTRNFQTCLERARGELVHLLHGDDFVRDGFYRAMQHAFTSEPSIGAAFCRHLYVDERGCLLRASRLERLGSGLLDDALERLASRQCVQPPSIVVRRTVYERLGGFDQRMTHCGEDWEMWVRIAAHYKIWYEVEPLAAYRKHDASLAGRAMSSGQNMRDTRISIATFQDYLPSDVAQKIAARARESAALWAVSLARRASSRGERETMWVQVREALRTRCSWPVLREATRVLLRARRRRASRSGGSDTPPGGRGSPRSRPIEHDPGPCES